jgi:integrase
MKTNLSNRLLPWVEQFVLKIPHLENDSHQRYQATLLSFISYLQKLTREEGFTGMIKEEIITRWLKEMHARYSLYTVLPRVGTVNGFLSFLEEKGCVEENPLARLQKQYPLKGLKGIVLALVGSSPEDSLKKLKSPPRFASPLGAYMERYIALHRSHGRAYTAEEPILCRFDRFLVSHSEPPPTALSDSILTQWLSLFAGSKPQHRYKTFTVIRRFCLYLRRFQPDAYVPDPSLTPPPPGPFFPHIYSRSEIGTLLGAARQLKASAYSPLRPQMFYLLIMLLYTTGMRLGEALRLRLGDIDRKSQSLCIRQTKFFKSRLVPLSSSVMKDLEDYLRLRQRSGAPMSPDSFIFQNPHQKGPYSNSAIQEPFRRMLKRLGLKLTQGHSGPRIHDLRHTFAVHRLEEWYRRGCDVQSRLGVLSTYLGHVGIASTQRYLTMTTELLQQASQRFSQYFNQKEATQ